MTKENLQKGIVLIDQIDSYKKILDNLDPELQTYDFLALSGKYHGDPNLDWIFDADFTSELADLIRGYFNYKIKALEKEFEAL